MTVSNVNVSAATLGTYIYTATGGETSKSGPDDNGATLSYTPGKELVHVNGVLLVKTSDYTATDGSSITLVNALVAGDVLEVISFSPFSVANAIPSTVVTAKGDLIAASSSGTVTNLPVGADGTTLVANSSASTGVSWGGQPYAQPVLNSAFQIWQRGTSFTPAAFSIVYTADRWCSYRNSANYTISRQTTSDTTNLPNIQYCLRNQRNSGNTATDAQFVSQSIETANSIPFAGKTVTLSFYARAGANFSAASNQITTQLVTGTGTDQNTIGGYTGSSTPLSTSTTLTTTWQRFSYNVSISATATEIGLNFYYNGVGTAGTNDYFEVTGVQIDLGSVALPFRTNSGTLQGELMACQRYYYRLSSPNNAFANMGIGYASSTTAASSLVAFPVTMRTQPSTIDFSTIRLTDLATGFAITAVAYDGSFGNPNNGSIALTVASGLTAAKLYYVTGNNSTSAYLGFSAEL